MKPKKKSIKDFKKVFNEKINENFLSFEDKNEAIILSLYFMQGYFERDNSLISKVLNEIIQIDINTRVLTKL